MDVVETEEFTAWLTNLRDRSGGIRFLQRIQRVRRGLLGAVKSLCGGISEMRVDHGPGCRVYSAARGDVLIILLCGGTRKGQQRDIQRARHLAAEQEH